MAGIANPHLRFEGFLSLGDSDLYNGANLTDFSILPEVLFEGFHLLSYVLPDFRCVECQNNLPIGDE